MNFETVILRAVFVSDFGTHQITAFEPKTLTEKISVDYPRGGVPLT